MAKQIKTEQAKQEASAKTGKLTPTSTPPAPKPRASKGEGEIICIKKGQVYRIRPPRMGKDPKTGKYIKPPMKTVNGTIADARHAMAKYIQELKDGYDFKGGRLTVGMYARQFQQQRRALGNLSPLTIERDEIETDRIEEHFGTVTLKGMSVGLINTTYAKLRSDSQYSQSQLHKLHAKLSQILKQAVREEIIDKNPCDLVSIKRPKARERRSLSVEQAIQLAEDLRAEDQRGYIVAIWLALATGIRRGEALGLTWRYVDFERKQIYIAQQLANDKKLREPKSEKSNRWVGIDDETVEYLQSWKTKQAAELEAVGMKQGADTPVVTNELGVFADPNNFSRWRRDYFVTHELGNYTKTSTYTDAQGHKHTRSTAYDGFNFHELRHTQATLLIGSGADIKTVQHRLGHSSASLTMNIYAHAIAANDRTAADTIGDTIFGGDK